MLHPPPHTLLPIWKASLESLRPRISELDPPWIESWIFKLTWLEPFRDISETRWMICQTSFLSWSLSSICLCQNHSKKWRGVERNQSWGWPMTLHLHHTCRRHRPINNCSHHVTIKTLVSIWGETLDEEKGRWNRVQNKSGSFPYNVGGETVAQVAQRSCGGPIPGSV